MRRLWRRKERQSLPPGAEDAIRQEVARQLGCSPEDISITVDDGQEDGFGTRARDVAHGLAAKTKAVAVQAHDSGQAVLASSASAVNSGLARLLEGAPTAVDRAMDAEYLRTSIGGGMHRLYDGGHTLWGATKAAMSTDDGIVTKTTDLVRGLARDVTTPNGLPFVTWDKGTYDAVSGWLQDKVGLSRSTFAELTTYTAADALAALLGAAQLAFRWTDGQAKDFARIATTTGVSAMLTTNPVVAVVSFAALAKTFTAGRRDGWDGTAGEVAKGAATMAVAPVVMAAGGPASVAIVASVIGAMAVEHLSPAAGREARRRMQDIKEWMAERKETNPEEKRA